MNSDYAGNFEDLLNAAPKGQSWSFWYGALELHRGYEYGAGVAKGGKKLTDSDRVPGFWPDNEVVRNDMVYINNYEIERWPAGNPETGLSELRRQPDPRMFGEGYIFDQHQYSDRRCGTFTNASCAGRSSRHCG